MLSPPVDDERRKTMELNKELLEKVKKMKTPEELLAFAEENGIEMTKEKADAYFKQLGTSPAI